MSIFRSEDMGLYMLSLEKNFAPDVMDSLGRLSCLHFVDVNNKEQVYNRAYSTMIRRCDEAARRMKYIEGLCERYKKPIKPVRSVESFLTGLQQVISAKGKDSMAYFEELEHVLSSAEEFLLKQLKEAESAFAQYTSIMQHRYVLNKASEIVLARTRYLPNPHFSRGGVKEGALNILSATVEKVMEDKSGISFSYIAGLIPKEDSFRFKRLLFRRTRGNVVTVLHDLEQPIETFDKKPVDKTLYVVIFRESEIMHTSVNRVCEAFSNEMYLSLPSSS